MSVSGYTRLVGTAVVMVLLSACGDESVEEKIVGTWYNANVPRDQAIEATFSKDRSFEVYAGYNGGHAYADRNAEATWELRPVEGSDEDLHLLYVSERTAGRDETTTYPLSLVKFEGERLLLSTFRSPQITEVKSMEDLDEPPIEFARDQEGTDS